MVLPKGRGASEWEVTPSELKRYTDLFRQLDEAGAGEVEPVMVKQVLESSKLPIKDLEQIWDLSEEKGVDRVGLALGEFVCAMALVARRKQDLPLPKKLPPELAQHLGGDRMAARA